MVEAGHAGKANLDGDSDVALDLFGAPAVGLGNNLDERRNGVRICLDVEREIRQYAANEDDERAHPHDERQTEREGDELLDQGTSR